MQNKKLFVFLLSGSWIIVSLFFCYKQVFAGEIPIITNEEVGEITSNTVKITWETNNQSSDSKVYYGISPTELSLSNYTNCDGSSSSSGVINHCVNLTHLMSGTTYYYKAVSTVLWSSGMSNEIHSFTTLPVGGSTSGSVSSGGSPVISGSWPTLPTAPSGVEALQIFTVLNGIQISWVDNSNDETSFVLYRFNELNGSLESVATLGTDITYYNDYLSSSGIYKYYVDACNSTGCSSSSYSNLVNLVTSGSGGSSSTTGTTGTSVSTTSTSISNPTTVVPTLVGVKILKGKVVSNSGDRISNAKITAYKSGTSQKVEVYTDALGIYSATLSDGTWEITAEPNTSSPIWSVTNPRQIYVFSSSSMEETGIVNFTVLLNSSSIIDVLVSDNSGYPVSGAIVSILDHRGSIETKTTYSDGHSVFDKSSGSYVVTVSPPSGYVAVSSLERTLSVVSGVNSNISFSVAKQISSDTVTVSGITKLDDDTPVSALVWAWSDDGEKEQTISSQFGEFSMILKGNQTWHIGSSKDHNSSPYKSTEILVDTGSQPPYLNLILTKYGTEAIPVPVSASASATENLVVSGTDGSSLSIPAGSIATSGDVSAMIKPTVEAPSQKSSAVVSTVYDITAKDSSGQNLSVLRAPVEIVLPYDEQELKNKGVKLEDIIPSYFDEEKRVWVAVPNFKIDRDKKVFILNVEHLTRFALIASADTTPPQAPSLINVTAQNGGKIKIDWTSSMKDVSHFKIYRSEVVGELGKVIATVVINNSFTDQNGLSNGKTYYYTIRSVDPAGNESNNLGQNWVMAVGDSPGSQSTGISNTSLSLPPGQALKGEILRNLSVGSSGEDVKVLQELLIQEGVYPDGLITGYFGNLTKEAVKRFQEKYASEILVPADLTKGNGFVGSGTRKKINEILGNQGSSSAISSKTTTSNSLIRNLSLGSKGEDVKVLQELLIQEGVYPDGLITGYFGNLTKEAVKRFQEKYASEILVPADLTKGNGFVGSGTRKKINSLISQ